MSDTPAMEWCEPPVLPVGGPLPPSWEPLAKRKFRGKIPTTFLRFSHCPWIQEGLLEPEPSYAFIGYELADLIALVVSQDNSCRFCVGTTRAFLRMMGQPDEIILKLETDLHHVDLDPGTRLALDYARRISRANPRPGTDEHKALKDAGFKEEAIAEIALTAAFNVYLNRLHTLSATQLAEFENLPDRWYAPLMKPLFRWRVAQGRKPSAPVPPLVRASGAPAAELFAVIGGLPLAHKLGRLLDGAFASDILPLRTKLLCSAVIARALGCRAFEDETRQGLEAVGVGVPALSEVLDHLDSAALTPVERRLVPAARETVRYSQAIQIQHRMRALAEELPPAVLLEGIGIFSLANALGRLTALLDRC